MLNLKALRFRLLKNVSYHDIASSNGVGTNTSVQYVRPGARLRVVAASVTCTVAEHEIERGASHTHFGP